MRIHVLWYVIIISAICLFGNSQVLAQNEIRQRQYVFRQWNNKSGLPQNTVNDMVRDDEGYLWIATEEGMVRFDGLKFSVRNELNTPGLFSNTFYDLSPSAKGIWAASRNTLVHIYKDKIRTIDFRKHLEGAWIRAIEEDSRGRLWVGTSFGTLFYLDGDSIKHVPGWAGQQSGSISDIKEYRSGMLVGSAKGLFQMSLAGELQQAIPQFKGVEVTALALDQRNLWVGTAQQGLFCMGSNSVQITEKEGLRDQHIRSLAVAADGSVWIGTRNTGYQVYANGKLTTPPQQEVAEDGIMSILLDEERIWLGTTSSGLVQAKPAEVMMLPASTGLAQSIVLPIYQHPSGEVWIGTAGKGVSRIEGNKITHFNTSNGLSHNLTLSVHGNDDAIFIGTSNGVDRFNRKTGKIDQHYTTRHGLNHNAVHLVFYDSRKRLWIGSKGGGIQYLEGNNIATVQMPSALMDMRYISIFEDRKGQIWLGSRGGGLVRIDANGNITHFNQAAGFPADVVYNSFEDGNGDLWHATDKGIVAYYKGKFQVFDKTNGLHFNEVYRLLEDNRGFLWCSGNFGLQRVALAELQQARNKSKGDAKLQVRLFNQVDGMTNAEANGGIFPAGWKMQDGSLWFPTVEGVAIADPNNINEAKRPLNIKLETVSYHHKKFPATAVIEIPAGTANLEIDYTSIDFSKAEDIKYYFRLSGLHKEWIPAGNRRTAYFSGLAPGDYRFEVKAEQYGQWSPTVSLQIRQQPWFYQTTWFRLLLAAIVVAIVIAVIVFLKRKAAQRLREQKNLTKAQLTGQEKERQIIGAELHDNINQQLTTVKLYLDFARNNDDMRLAMVEKSEQVVQKVINELRHLCKSLIPPTLKDIGLKESLRELMQAYTVADTFKVHFYTDVPLDNLEEDLRFSIFRILQEQLTNITRHASAENVWIDFRMTAQGILFTVRDDGRGFSPEAQAPGVGLTNIQNRLDLFNGTMNIWSSPGNGCYLEIKLPVDAKRYPATEPHRETIGNTISVQEV